MTTMTASPHQRRKRDEPLNRNAERDPLSSNELSQLDAAYERSAKLRRAARVALLSGWSLGIFAALTLPFAFFSMQSLLMGIALAAITRNEFRGHRLLLDFDESGPGVLAKNQVILMGTLVVYSAWNIYSALHGPTAIGTQLNAIPEMTTSLGNVEDLYVTIAIVVYETLIVSSVLFQGLHAWYYFSRLKYVKDHLARTPDWVLELQRLRR